VDEQIIIGIDPGLGATGYGVIKRHNGHNEVVEGGVIRSKRSDPLEKRLLSIFKELQEIFIQFQPHVVVIEELYSHFGHPRTSITMGHARGVVLLAAAECSVPVCSYSATRIKQALTGNGRASKEQIQRAVQVRLGLEKQPSPPDVADALAAALCHTHVMSRTDALNDVPL